MENKPTQEQIREFWEWCGFYQEDGQSDMDGAPYKVWKYPDSSLYDYGYGDCPKVLTDLNNLFKYAVPRACNYSKDDNMLIIKGQGKDTNSEPDDDGEWWEVEIEGCAGKYKAEAKDPALALFWAIWEVIHNGE